MNILNKCKLCNHRVWPLQKTSPTAGDGVHYACHRVAINISRQNPFTHPYLDRAIDDFERKTGRPTGFNNPTKASNQVDQTVGNESFEMEYTMQEAYRMVEAFPDQPSHRDHAEELRSICEPFLALGK